MSTDWHELTEDEDALLRAYRWGGRDGVLRALGMERVKWHPTAKLVFTDDGPHEVYRFRKGAQMSVPWFACPSCPQDFEESGHCDICGRRLIEVKR